MNKMMDSLVFQYVDLLKKLYQERLKAVILYGSCARGDNTAESDVDIMVLLDVDDDGLCDSIESISQLTFEFNLSNNVYFSPMMENITTFKKWSQFDPFYENVKKDGVWLYEAA